jgi:hypothetical protein
MLYFTWEISGSFYNSIENFLNIAKNKWIIFLIKLLSTKTKYFAIVQVILKEGFKDEDFSTVLTGFIIVASIPQLVAKISLIRRNGKASQVIKNLKITPTFKSY